MGNDAAARNPDGSLKDSAALATDQKTTTDTKTAATSTDKAADTKATDTKTDNKTKDDKAAGPPEKYDLKAPEGYEIDPKMVEEFTSIAKELGLTNEQAQKLTDLYNKHSIESAEAPYKAYETMRTDWRAEVATSALGDGKDNLKPEVRANISKAYDAIGDAKAVEAFKAAMDLTGAGDNPAFIRAMNSWGKLLSEGTLVRGGSPSPGGQAQPGKIASPAQALYPNLPSSAV